MCFVVLSLVFFAPLCHSQNLLSLDKITLKTLWKQEVSESSKRVFLEKIILSLESASLSEADVASQFLANLIKEEYENRSLILNELQTLGQRSPRLSHWVISIIIASHQSPMIPLETMVSPNILAVQVKRGVAQMKQIRSWMRVKSVPNDAMSLPTKNTLPCLRHFDLFPQDPDPDETDEWISQLGDREWGIREQAYEKLSQKTVFDFKKALEQIQNNPDPEIQLSVRHLYQERLPLLWEKLKAGSIAGLSRDDKFFLMDHVFKFGIGPEQFNDPVSFIVIHKFQEIVADKTLALECFELLKPYWQNWRTQNYLDPLSDLFYLIATNHSEFKAQVFDLFKSFYDAPYTGNLDFIFKHKLPVMMTQLHMQPSEFIQQQVLSDSLRDSQRVLHSNLWVRASSAEPKTWNEIKKFILDPHQDREKRVNVIDHLYLKNTPEVHMILTSLAQNGDHPAIQMCAFQNLIDTSSAPEEWAFIEKLIFAQMAKENRDHGMQIELFKLFLKTNLVPSLEKMRPYLESSDTALRYVAFSVFSAQSREYEMIGDLFQAIQLYLSSEPQQDIQKMMIEMLTDRNVLARTPSKYMALYDYMEKSPKAYFKTEVQKFLNTFF